MATRRIKTAVQWIAEQIAREAIRTLGHRLYEALRDALGS